VHADVAAGLAALAFVEEFGGDDDVLGEVLGHAAAHHEQAGVLAGELDVGEFAEVLAGVEGDLATAFFDGLGLLEDDAEAGGAVRERGDEDRDALLEGGLDDRLVLGVVLDEVGWSTRRARRR
jgi:hypothetical protein